MDIRFHNTLTRRLERFEPLEPPMVTMYNCGPTVYDFAHIGNFRTFLFADLLRRFLQLAGYRVHQVMNLTDVGHMTEDDLADGGGEDKMQVAATRIKQAKKQGALPRRAVENPDDPYEVAQYYIDAFLADARSLRLAVADEYPQNMPRATEHIAPMQQLITRLIDLGHAYVAADGAVYYAVESFENYGRLSGNTLEKLRGGAGGRILAEHQAVKRHPSDFLLWKPDSSHIMKWDSPWGAGYPNWHIECSTMVTSVLERDVIDVHTGGEDNIFPHHECEIAQTCGATGNELFARTWMHARHLLVDGEKMSKRKGTFFTVRDVLDGKVTGRPVEPAVLRYELIRAHYRSNINFTAKGLEDSARAVGRYRSAAAACGNGEARADPSHAVVSEFLAALGDDLNISAALAVVFDWLKNGGGIEPGDAGVFSALDSVLGILPDTKQNRGGDADDAEARQACAGIDQARTVGDYGRADDLRRQLVDAGDDVMTTKKGTVANRKLA